MSRARRPRSRPIVIVGASRQGALPTDGRRQSRKPSTNSVTTRPETPANRCPLYDDQSANAYGRSGSVSQFRDRYWMSRAVSALHLSAFC